MTERLSNQVVVDTTKYFFPIERLSQKKGALGTDKEILGEDTPIRVPTKGRPRINRNLARRLFQAGFKTAQIASCLGCHVKTARRIRRELEEAGELGTELRHESMNIVADGLQ